MAILAGASITAFAANAASANSLVTNGDFETGDFTGWGLAGSTSNLSAALKYADLWTGPALTTSGNIFQIINGLTPGETYYYAFDFTQLSGGSIFSATGFGQTFMYRGPGSQPVSDARYVFEVTAGSASERVEFAALTNTAQGYRIDNVELVAAPGPEGGVPEPASWAMLIAGFGLTGAAMRRRRTSAAIA